MNTTIARSVFVKDQDFRYNPERGMHFERFYTKEGVSPFELFEYELRTSIIRETSGKVIFEMNNVEVPKTWSQVATDILAQKYFRKAGVPQYDINGMPKLDERGKPLFGSETSIKQVAHRLAGTWRYWAEKYSYFATATDAQVFYDELVYMIINQMVAPNSPQWFNTGLNWAYGINSTPQGHYYTDEDTGETKLSEDAYTHPQPHACFIQSVKDDLVSEGGIMDLWVREARLFKYGSGTGTNFSSLRGEGEPLSGGGSSSGLMSWLKIGDRAAGAIKSGGTTRRAAKMVILDVNHPDIEKFVEWKVNEEKKVAVLLAAGYDSSYEGEAYNTVSGQNSNNTVRVTQQFMEAVEQDSNWDLIWRTNGQVGKTIKARDLWNKISQAAWLCADPGLQFDTTINDWHTCPQSGRINASNPCSEYMFIDDTACNLASVNLGHYYNAESGVFDVVGFRHTVRVWTLVLEISVLMAQYPSEAIARNSYRFRTLGLGYANIGSVLMTAGMPYDSIEAMNYSAAITAIMTAESYITSAEIAKARGPFIEYEKNRDDMLRVMRNHRRVAYNASAEEYEGVSIPPDGLDINYTPDYMLRAARESWDKALGMGEKYGYRNAQTTVLAPTGTIGLIMDCATTGVEPDFALVKFKKLAGGGYFKIVNSSVSSALRVLGYSEKQIDDIIKYLKGSGSLEGSPHINSTTLKEKGFLAEDIAKIEKTLPSVFELQFAFNSWTLGEECLSRLGFTAEQWEDPNFNLLKALGYSDQQIMEANEFVCGAMTIESAPHLKQEHYAVFDTANKNGHKGKRYIHYLGHIKMLAAVQPFISGSISKTVNMPNEATIEDIKAAYMASWKLGLKANALYRDGCKLSQPLSTRSSDKNEKEYKSDEKQETNNNIEIDRYRDRKITNNENLQSVDQTYVFSDSDHNDMVEQIVKAKQLMTNYAHDGSEKGKRVYLHGEQRKLPYKRTGITVKTKINGQSVFIRTGEYPDGKLGEIFIDMYKEGAAFRSMLSLFGVSISAGLQYGVPLEEYVDKFAFTRFEPSGMTDHPNIRSCTSIIDFVFRLLGMEYLGRTDFVQVKPQGIQKNKAESLAKMAAAAVGQKTMELKDDDKEILRDKEINENQLSLPNIPKIKLNEPVDQSETFLINIQSDAPPCGTCGHTTVRNGTCYKCLNCGSTTGCS